MRRKSPGRGSRILLWLGVFLFLGCGSSAGARTLHNALTEVMTRLGSNLQARGEIVARLDGNEVVVEYQDDQVPAYGAELLVFSPAAEVPETETGKAAAPPGGLIFHGSITVRESAGHLNLALIDEGRDQVAAGDRVFLPTPVAVYFPPLRNLTPYPFLTRQATAAIARLLKLFPRWQVYSLPGTNQTTVSNLRRQCRNQGRYGLVVQPLIINQNGRFKVQLRLTSLFSGMSLNLLEAEFFPFAGVAPAAPRAPYRRLSPRPYPVSGTPSAM